MNEKIRQSLKMRLIAEEGFRQFVYHCPAGKLTVGVGRNLEDKGVNIVEATLMLDNDIDYFDTELPKYFPCYKALSDARKSVLVDMAFNLGIRGLHNFKKMIDACDKRDYETAAKEMLNSSWAIQVGKRADNLAEIMRKDNL